MTRIPIEDEDFREDREEEGSKPGEEAREGNSAAAGGQPAASEMSDIPAVGAESRIQKLEGELEKKELEAKQSFERLLRLQAEFENYKKRILRDREEQVRYASEKVLKEFLPIVDNLYRALEAAAMGGKFDSLKAGLDLILQQLREVLQRLGVREIKSLGESFDPRVHDAVMRVDSPDHEDNIVVDELEKGYYLHDRILRPAKVTVCKRSEGAGEER